MNHAELRLSAALVRLRLPRFYSCLFRIFSRNAAGKSSNPHLCFTRFLKALFFFQRLSVSILKLQPLAAPEPHRPPESPPISPSSVSQQWSSKVRNDKPLAHAPNQQMSPVTWLQKPDLPPQVSSSVEAKPLQFLLIQQLSSALHRWFLYFASISWLLEVWAWVSY